MVNIYNSTCVFSTCVCVCVCVCVCACVFAYVCSGGSGNWSSGGDLHGHRTLRKKCFWGSSRIWSRVWTPSQWRLEDNLWGLWYFGGQGVKGWAPGNISDKILTVSAPGWSNQSCHSYLWGVCYVIVCATRRRLFHVVCTSWVNMVSVLTDPEVELETSASRQGAVVILWQRRGI